MSTDPEDITRWQRIDARLTTSGWLRPEDVTRLSGIGVRQVINLALADSPGALADEAELLAAEGIAYAHIPVPFDAPDDSHFAWFCDAMAAGGDEAVHVHCIMNWRVSAFLYRYNREVRAMPEDDARALLEQQWSPETSEHKDAPVWSKFIAR